MPACLTTFPVLLPTLPPCWWTAQFANKAEGNIHTKGIRARWTKREKTCNRTKSFSKNQGWGAGAFKYILSSLSFHFIR